jgi:hypothetical protein
MARRNNAIVRKLSSLKMWDVIEVTWVDAKGASGELSLEDAKAFNTTIRRTLGYFICANDKKIVTAGTDDRNSTDNVAVAECSAIPTPWACSVKKFRA